MTATTDVLVIGGGVIGLAVAREAKRRHPDLRVTLLEKEPRCGLHASGRNSGVLHAGFYYSADSLKARFTREGNRLLTEFCLERGLAIRRCGKLVVARHAGEIPTLEELYRRGQVNGVELKEIAPEEAREIEPSVKTVGKALWSPTTASVDPAQVMAALAREAEEAGVEIRTGVAFHGRHGERLRTSAGELEAGYVINAAGLYADQVARAFGFGLEYAILPFKGLYLYSDAPAGAMATNIYPVPNLDNPFLGVHTTLTVTGRVKLGPTAIPAFWREHYQGLEGFRLGEFLDVVGREAGLFWHNDFNFRRLAWQELQKHSRRRMVTLARELMEPVRNQDYRHWGPPGLRAQLLHLPTRRMEMDFRTEGDARSFHVLNAVSPGFTCALSFSRYLLDEIARLQNQG